MSDELKDIELQIQELLKKKEELERKKLEEPPFKFPASTVTITQYGKHQLSIKLSTKRMDYVEQVARNLPSRKFDWNLERDIIDMVDWPKFDELIKTLPDITVNNKAIEYILYYFGKEHARVSINDKDATIKVHPIANPYYLFKELYNSVVLLNHNDSLYHIPKNELHRLLVISQNYKDAEFNWDDDAKTYALKDLENRRLLDEIALAQDAPDFDPDLNGNRLKPFQRVGLKFAMTSKQTIGNGNIRVLISDEMGLGKTPQAIATCVMNESKRIAVICPASVKENWRREIVKFTGESSKTLKGVQPQNDDIADIVTAKTRWFIFNYDILSRPILETKDGTSKQRFLWVETINALGFDTVILDEAHKCKNIDAARTKAVLRFKVPNIIELTGTPVINRPLELWPGLHLLSPETFNNQDGFKQRYTNGNYGVRNVEELRSLLRPYMIRRVKSDVQKDLPPIIRTTQHVELNSKQRKIYQKMLDGILVNLETGEEKDYINHILVKILRLKQYLSKVKAESIAEFATELYDQANPEDPYKKVIIFSQFVPIVHRIRRLLGHEALYIVGSDHSPLERQLIVDEFQNDPVKKFLVATPQSTSEGLNITAAGHVIFVDFVWTPATHQQAEGRAYGRLSDPHTIESHYFAVEDSLDDWLRSILLQKMETIEAVVDGVNDQRMQEGSVIKELIKALKRGDIK